MNNILSKINMKLAAHSDLFGQSSSWNFRKSLFLKLFIPLLLILYLSLSFLSIKIHFFSYLKLKKLNISFKIESILVDWNKTEQKKLGFMFLNRFCPQKRKLFTDFRNKSVEMINLVVGKIILTFFQTYIWNLSHIDQMSEKNHMIA